METTKIDGDEIMKSEYGSHFEYYLNKIGASFKNIKIEIRDSMGAPYTFQFMLHDTCHWIQDGHNPTANPPRIHCHESAYVSDLMAMADYYKCLSVEEANQKEKEALIYEVFYVREKFNFPEDNIKSYLNKKICYDYKGGKDLPENERQNIVEEIWKLSYNVNPSVISKIEKIFLNWSKDLSIKFLNEKEFIIQ